MAPRKRSSPRPLLGLALPIVLAVLGWLARDAAPPAAQAASDDPVTIAAPVPSRASAAPATATPAPVATPVAPADGIEVEAQLAADLAADPVAKQVPMLFHVGREMQLETLRWLLHVPEDKVAAAVPAIGDRRDLSPGVRRDKARAVIADLIAGLERDGVQAPSFADDFVAARLVGLPSAR